MEEVIVLGVHSFTLTLDLSLVSTTFQECMLVEATLARLQNWTATQFDQQSVSEER
jgi:hypothetical protein